MWRADALAVMTESLLQHGVASLSDGDRQQYIASAKMERLVVIDAETARTGWRDKRMEYGFAIDPLLLHATATAARAADAGIARQQA
jgi:hypothetical protein